MTQTQVEAIIERWMSDEAFRDSMRAAPLETVEREGFKLSEEEKEALRNLDLSQSDEELARQASYGT